MPEGRTDELLSWAKEQLKADQDRPIRRIDSGFTLDALTNVRTALREGVAEAAAILLPGDSERQQLIPGLLLTGPASTLPLLDETHPADLLLRIADWDDLLKAVDTRPAADRVADPALAVVGAKILERLRQADETDAVGSIWRHFVEETGIGAPVPLSQAAQGAAGATLGGGTNFQLDNPQAHNLIQGQTVQVHMSPPSAPAAPAAPLRPHNFKRGPLLLGRIPQLAAARLKHAADYALAQILGDGPDAKVCLVVSGLAGTGKTQIAAAYARDHWDSAALQLMVWVKADSRAAITAAFAEAAARACGSTGSDPDRAAAEFLDWLDRPTGPRWLIVLDGVTDPQHLVGLWPPESAHGRTVVTSRIRSASWRGARRAAVNISSFTLEESAAFFREQFGEHSNRNEGAVALADHLGGLPLALAQAAAFIHNHPDLTCEDYFRMLVGGDISIEDLCPGTALDGYPTPLGATLRQSIDLTEQHPPKGLCLGLLNMLSLLASDGVPVELLRSEPVLEALNADIARSGDPSAPHLTAWAVNAAVARLHQLSLIDSEGGTVRIHSLVQRLVLKQFPAEARGEYARALADTIKSLWPEDENDLKAMLRASGLRLRELVSADLVDERAHELLFLMGNSLGTLNRFTEALEYFTRLEVDLTRTLGSEHVDTLFARGRAAWWQFKNGDLAGAMAAEEELLLDRLRLLGPDHEETLLARDDLAWLRGEAGDASEAIDAYLELIPDWERARGADNTRTLEARAFLAYWRKQAGDPATAAAELAALLDDRVRALGPEHADTLATRFELGDCLGESGNEAAAAEAHRELLSIRTRLQGPDHAFTLDVHFKYARWLGLSGDAAGAVAEYEKLLPDLARVFGPDAEDTLLARNNLAHFRSVATGDRAAAVAEYESLLVDVERVYGPDHPNTTLVGGNLAAMRE